jgi:hypothetical protein
MLENTGFVAKDSQRTKVAAYGGLQTLVTPYLYLLRFVHVVEGEGTAILNETLRLLVTIFKNKSDVQ